MDKLVYVLGGAAWINLVNTTYISNKQEVDILADASRTCEWLKENNVLRESDVPALKDGEWRHSLINELHSLRQLCEMVLFDVEQKGVLSPDTTDQLKQLVERVNVSLTMDADDEKVELVSEGITTEDHVLFKIVASIFDTLNSTSIRRIRKCEHQECRLHFVDTSKSGKRRWCSMELCGNRKKAAEFYAKNKKK
ncbi:CGNR zinc finger domain-containing protein [Salibacterium aidingense]|uniref:CGNR zinc finger domain-containing protein n=1 Tax=Salibacterium aidingense TaxID=384933 RepID=UPI00047E08DE|nr:CGNR zinc finger domain-containing protein [Salibacterium aidingense]